MAGLQTIIDKCNGLTINRRKVVGLQITRNEIPRVTLTPTTQPWRFTLDMPSSLRYNEARDLMEALDTIDRVTPELITFSNNSALSWIFKYQGQMSAGQINTIRVQSFSANSNQLVLTNLPIVPSSFILFKPNDLIQIGSYPYPFTVSDSTDITRGTGSTVTITTNRPNILSATISPGVLGITVGNDCDFNMFCPNMPVYKLVPGGFMRNGNGVVSNNALLEFSDAFELYEYVATA